MSKVDISEQGRIFAEEAAVVDAQALLHGIMEKRGISRAELARAMNVSRARITQIFSEDCSNLTVRLLARAMFALREELHLCPAKRDQREALNHFMRFVAEAYVAKPPKWIDADFVGDWPQTTTANDNIFTGLREIRSVETYEEMAA